MKSSYCCGDWVSFSFCLQLWQLYSYYCVHWCCTSTVLVSSVKFSMFLNIEHMVERGHSLKLNKKRARLDLRQHFFTDRIVNIWNHLDKNTVPYVPRYWTVSRDIWIHFIQLRHFQDSASLIDPKKLSQSPSGAASSSQFWKRQRHDYTVLTSTCDISTYPVDSSVPWSCILMMAFGMWKPS